MGFSGEELAGRHFGAYGAIVAAAEVREGPLQAGACAFQWADKCHRRQVVPNSHHRHDALHATNNPEEEGDLGMVVGHSTEREADQDEGDCGYKANHSQTHKSKKGELPPSCRLGGEPERMQLVTLSTWWKFRRWRYTEK
jgi:hypothetical protein